MIFSVELCGEDGSLGHSNQVCFIVGDSERDAANRHGLIEMVDNGGWFSRFLLPGTQFQVTLNKRQEACNLAEMIKLAEAARAKHQ